MQISFKQYICGALLISTGLSASTHVAPLMSPRSRSADSALELVGWTNQIHLDNKDDFYGTFAITPQYDRTFRANRTISPVLFGSEIANCECPTINISGKCADDRTSQDWLADYFGLPQDFKSYVTFAPRVDSVSVNLSAFFGLNFWCKGMYFKVHAPVEHVRYRLGFEETIINKGMQPHEEGYFSDVEVPRENLLADFESFVSGCKVPVLDGIIPASNANDGQGTPAPGNVEFQRLECAKIKTCGKLTKTRLSDLTCALGWYVVEECDRHLSLELRVAAPTGNRPEGDYFFEPIVGNGHHWELGGGISGHVRLWECSDEQSHFDLWVQANVSHLFKTSQRRFFDLVNNGPHSRYMLAAKMQSPAENLFASTDPNAIEPVPTAPSAQFARVFRPVANLTCCDVDVSIGVQGDVSAMFNYTYCNWSWDVGYNFWGRSCEKISRDCDCPCTLENESGTWVLKGDAHVIGFTPQGSEVASTDNQPIALSASDSKATIFSGSNVPAGRDCNSGRGDPANTPTSFAPDTRRNQYIDNPEFAFSDITIFDEINFRRRAALAANGDNNQTNTSHDPIFLSINDIDFCSAETKGRSHKIFTHLSYTWSDAECWTPYIGFGGKVEFSKSTNCCTDMSCKPCPTTTDRDPCSFGSSCGSCSDCCTVPCRECLNANFSEWGVWIKGGLSFD